MKMLDPIDVGVVKPTKAPKSPKAFDLSTAPASQIADLGDIKQCTGKSRATIYRWVRLGILPKPRKLGPTCNFWTAGEIRDALAKVMGGAA